ncbi:MAG: NADH-quinone oxidoreductase subunit M [Nitrospiria bacterium]
MISTYSFPILSFIAYIPLIGCIVLMFMKKEDHKAIMQTALGVSLFTMLVSFVLIPGFDSTKADMQFVEQASWIPSLGVEYVFGIDGISLLLIIMTTILTAISIVSSFTAITERVKEYYIAILFLETGMLGVFMSLDFFLFYIFWEIMLVPMYFMIGIWGGGRRLYSCIKFFLYTLFGSLFMLLGILAIYFLNGNPAYGTGQLTFSILELQKLNLPLNPFQYWLFLAFFLGFAIKVPMFPFHTWLPDAHTDAPTAGSVLLAGVLLKMGTYGFVRFCLPIFPDASHFFVPMICGLSLVGIVYGAFVALAQKDVKRLVAYSSVSHLGFVMLGLFALNRHGITGGILQMINHGVSTGALFLIVGMIYERRHTRLIADFGGLSYQMPVFAAFFAVTMFSSMGLPGLNGFVGEFLILVGAFEANKIYAGIAVVGIILGAAYMLWLFQRMMFGKLDKPENQKLLDMNRREVAYMVPLVVFMFWIGLYPKPFIQMMEPSVEKIVQRLNASSAKRTGSEEKVKKVVRERGLPEHSVALALRGEPGVLIDAPELSVSNGDRE